MASPSARGRGRPKRDAVLTAATKLFLDRGYGGTSIEMIAEEAGVSRQTIYNQFDSKESLFLAISRHLVDETIAPLQAACGIDEDPGVTLRALGTRYLDLALRPSTLAFHRVLVAEAGRFPEIGRAVLAGGAGRAVALLADYLRRQSGAGRLGVRDPELAAEQFFGMLGSYPQFRALMSGADEAGAGDRRRRVEAAVAAFLRAYAPD